MASNDKGFNLIQPTNEPNFSLTVKVDFIVGIGILLMIWAIIRIFRWCFARRESIVGFGSAMMATQSHNESTHPSHVPLQALLPSAQSISQPTVTTERPSTLNPLMTLAMSRTYV